MPLSTQWPHHPTRLSDLIDHETLAVVISGSCARLKRALTVLDYDKQTGAIARIDPLIEWQNFELFCQLLRTESRVSGGNAACERCDIQRAQKLVGAISGARCADADNYRCHMGLIDYSQTLCVDDTPVAVLLAGQFAASKQKEEVQRQVERIVSGDRKDIALMDDAAGAELRRLVAQIPAPTQDFIEQFRREAEYVQTMATAHYHRQKAEYQGAFLDKLRGARRFSRGRTLLEIGREVERLLQIVQQHCGLQYLVMFCNVAEGDTVLTPIAHVGLHGADLNSSELPHFNWTKSGLPKSEAVEGHWFIARDDQALVRGVRGHQAIKFSTASCAIALTLGDAYRMVMLFGPFAHCSDPRKEATFLFDASRIIGWGVFAQMQALRLHEERERLTATTLLLQHRLKTALTPIATHIGRAKMQLNARQYDASLRTVLDQVRAAHDLSLQLGRSARETTRSATVMVERDDLKYEMYPLSVLVANCAEGFVKLAEERGRELSINSTVERLPYAEVDIARLTIAISNLLDNAVKYSFPTTRIQVMAMLPNASDQRHTTIIVQDLGDPVPHDKMSMIFERGQRALAEAKMGKIPGMGYGLWEARAVVEAHGGSLHVQCNETNIHLRQGRAYRVSFLVKLPLRQADRHA